MKNKTRIKTPYSRNALGILSLLGLAAFHPHSASATEWKYLAGTPPEDQDWNNAANWSAGVPGGGFFIRDITGGLFPIIDDDLAATANGNSFIGAFNGANSRLDIRSGSLAVTGQLAVAPDNPSNAILNLADTATDDGNNLTGYAQGSGSLSTTASMVLARRINSTATVNINTTGSFSAAGESQILVGGGGGATVNLVSGSFDTIHFVGGLVLGGLSDQADDGGSPAKGSGTFNMSGGTMGDGSASKQRFIRVGRQGTGEFNQTGGTVNLGNNMEIGVVADSTGTVNLSGGTFSMGQLRVGMEGNGTMTISGNAAVTARTFNNSILIGSGAGNGTLNLDGGSLTTRLVNSGGTGTSIFNFNGGTLVFTNFLADAFEGLTQANILSGGAFIDTNGNGVTIEQNLQGVGGLTKLGSNTLTLAGSNTYTGDTTVNSGTLSLNSAVSLNEESDVVIGDGTLNVPGAVGISAATLNVTSANATINLGVGSTFAFDPSSGVAWVQAGALNITGSFVAGSSIRFGLNKSGLTPAQLAVITVNGGGTYTLNEDGFLVAGTAPGGYAQWASTNAPTGDPYDDFDGDGVANAVEYVLGGDKDTNDLGKLPVPTISGGNLLFTFERDQDSVDGSTIVQIEVGTDLVNWPNVYNVGADTGSSSAGVSVTDNEDGSDTIVLTVAQALDVKKFSRLKVTVTP